MNNIHQFPNQEPFDLEKFLNDIKKQFSKRKTNGSGGSGGWNSPWTGPSISLFLLAVILLWAGFTSYYKIEVGYEGVVTRFGKYTQTTDPGLHFKLPFGIDNVFTVPSKRTFQEEFGFRTEAIQGTRTEYSKLTSQKESLMLTGDLNVADVEWAIQYRIKDPWKFLFHARDVRRNIRDISMSIMRRVVGDRLADDVLTTGRVVIALEAKELMQSVLDGYDMGIHIEQVILQDVNPPDPVKPAFNEVNAAKQEQEQAINNAEREYNRIIPEARGKADKLIADSEAYSVDIVNRSIGDAERFEEVLQEYRRAPKITRDRIYIETMEEVLPKAKSITVIDKDIKGLLPLYGRTSPTHAAAGAN